MSMTVKRYPELTKALKRIAAPHDVDEHFDEYIGRAAQRCGLSYWRAFDMYYGKCRRPTKPEVIRIRDALLRAVSR